MRSCRAQCACAPATRCGRPVTHFPTTKVQALLAYLAVEVQSAHTRDALLGLFWAEYSTPSARQNLRKTLQRLRRLIYRDVWDVYTGPGLARDLCRRQIGAAYRDS